MIEHIIRLHMHLGNGDRIHHFNIQDISFEWFAGIFRALPMRYYIQPFIQSFGINGEQVIMTSYFYDLYELYDLYDAYNFCAIFVFMTFIRSVSLFPPFTTLNRLLTVL